MKILLFFLKLLSRLSWSKMALISTILAKFLQHIILYRKKTVYQNLKNSFPKKSSEELNLITEKFYQNLADRVFESIKMPTLSEAEILSHCTIQNLEPILETLQSGKSIVAVLGHCGSWELACLRASLAIPTNYLKYAIYTKIKNPAMDEFIKSSRGKFGMQLFSMQEIVKYLKLGFSKPSVGLFLSDQNHSNPQRAYWTTFLNQRTPFMTGPARFAKAQNSVLFFIKIKQTGRFQYAIENILLSNNAYEKTENELTELFVKAVENQIIENPADWLWSHKRWKQKEK